MNILWLIFMIIVFLIGGALVGIISAKLRRVFKTGLVGIFAAFVGGRFMMWGIPDQEPLFTAVLISMIIGVVAGYSFGLWVFPRTNPEDA